MKKRLLSALLLLCMLVSLLPFSAMAVEMDESSQTEIASAAPSADGNDRTVDDDSHTHNYIGVSIHTPPTETEEGIRAFYCSCGEYITETIPAIPSANTSDGVYVIEGMTEGSYLTATSGGDAVMQSKIGSDSIPAEEQQWQLIRGSDGSYEIVNVKYDRDLFVRSSSILKGANVCAGERSSNDAGRWFICSSEGSYVRFVNKRSYYTLDNGDGGATDGKSVYQWTDSSADSQKFLLRAKVTVTFDPNGGTGGTTQRVMLSGETYGTLPTPTRSGYTFLGWYRAKGADAARVTETTTVTSTSVQTLYAHWGKAVSAPGGVIYYDLENGSVARASTSVTSAVIRTNVEGVRINRIASRAFENCTALTSVSIPCSVRYIYSYAFKGCSSLTSVSIPEEVTQIESSLFSGCSNLTTLYLPAKITIERSLLMSPFGTRSITDIFYAGTEDQWKDVSAGIILFPFNSGNWTMHYGVTAQHVMHQWTPEVVDPPTESSIGLRSTTCASCGMVQSESIPKLDYITVQPLDAFGKIGDKVIFTVELNETGLTCQWQYSTDGGKTWKASSSTSTTATCTLTGAEREGWLYRCLVTDRNGYIQTSDTAKVVILPNITQQPKNASGKAGAQVKFTVAATGPGLTYQWQYSEDGGKTWKASSSRTTTATCTLVSGIRDGWLYRCIVKSSNGYTATSDTASVRVLPSINSQPKNASGKLGDKLTFTIGATGAGLTYKWQYSTDGGKSWKSSSSTTDIATCTLSTSTRDGWLYRCIVTDSHGTPLTSDTAKVTIVPVITVQPKDKVGVLGEKLTFTVAATGVNPTYQWQYSTDGGKTWKASSSKTNTATCTLSGAERNGWLYRCIVTDSHGKLTSSTAKVIIKTPLKITAQPRYYIGSVGGKAIFTVKATGDGLKYQWYYSEDDGVTWKRSSSTSAKATCTILEGRNGWLYHCVITDMYDETVTSTNARLIID